METPHIHVVYQFQQHVELMYRDSERTTPRNEIYERQGIVFLSLSVENGRWTREVAEYELGAEGIQSAREQEKVDRQELQAAHGHALKKRKIPFGLDYPVTIDSDLFNHLVAIPGPQRIPLRHDLVYLPSVLPTVPSHRPEPGKDWKGSIEILAGAGRFTLPYTVKLLERVGENPKTQVVFDSHPITAVIKPITLVLTPEGTWTIDIFKDDGSPLAVKGNFKISVQAKTERDGAPVDMEVLRCQQKVSLSKVPASFDDEFFYPAAWKTIAPHKMPSS